MPGVGAAVQLPAVAPGDGAGQRRLAKPGGAAQPAPLPRRLAPEPPGLRLPGRLPPLIHPPKLRDGPVRTSGPTWPERRSRRSWSESTSVVHWREGGESTALSGERLCGMHIRKFHDIGAGGEIGRDRSGSGSPDCWRSSSCRRSVGASNLNESSSRHGLIATSEDAGAEHEPVAVDDLELLAVKNPAVEHRAVPGLQVAHEPCVRRDAGSTRVRDSRSDCRAGAGSMGLRPTKNWCPVISMA